MKQIDILIKNGTVIDPSRNINKKGNIGIVEGKLIEIGNEEVKAEQVIDAEGYYVSPGWIDVHGHLYEGSEPNGLPVDIASLPMGVTAIIDAGSAGVANYPNLLKYLRDNKTRGKMMLNVSACGIIMPSQFPEPLDPSVWNKALFKKAIEKGKGDIIALKVRVQKNVVGNLGLEPLKKAVEAADELGIPVVVHTTDPYGTMTDVANILRPGDVLCHMYHGTGETRLDENGKVHEGIIKAKERGVIFDAASGRGNFAFEVAKKAIAQGFLPDSISTDITLQNWNHALAGALPAVMTKYLALGLTVQQIIERVTVGPSVQFGTEGLGTLASGTPADITIFDLAQKDITWKDKFGTEITTKEAFIPKCTIVNGEILYRSVDCCLV